MVKIIQKEDPLLRKKAVNVKKSDIGSTKIRRILESMKSALDACDDGVAIAAPQIGKSLRIFVISKKVLGDDAENDLVFINPKISKLSRKKVEMEEGCLSIRWLYGKVKRSERASVEALDEEGNKFTRGGSNLMAQIFQHETDHLDGVLFTDKARDVVEMNPADINNE